MFYILLLKQTEERDLEHFLVTGTVNTSTPFRVRNKYDECQSSNKMILQGQPPADLNTPHGTTLPQYRTSKTTRSEERNKHRNYSRSS